jgi:ABC-type lipoprotein release transport system permease subunit
MLLVAFGFSHYFPVARGLSVGTAVLVSLAVTGVVLLATWAPTRRAVRVEPRIALWQG